MYKSILKLLFPLIGLTAGYSHAQEFKLTSSDISHGNFMKNTFEFNGFGCTGGNKSPQLSWSGAPNGTKAFAIFAYDPDAPTGSGWWHWQAVNIPVEVNSIPSGDGKLNYKDVINVTNDYGQKGFGGACPPRGHGVHRYQFTVYALDQKLELPAAALTGYMVKAHSLGSSTIEALYKR